MCETSDGQDPPERIEWQSETIYPPSSRAATTRTIYFWGQAHIHTVGVRPLLHAAELVLTVTGVHIK